MSNLNLPESPPWGASGQDVYERTYSRKKANGDPETWYDTVVRVVDGNLNFVPAKFHEKNERNKLIALFYKMDAIPAGRHLWATGIAEGKQFVNNCHRAGWEHNDIISHFIFNFDQLLQGGGVGANYSDSYLKKYKAISHNVDLHITCRSDHPDIEEISPFLSEKFNDEWNGAIRVEDSREGWAQAEEQLLKAFFNGPNELIFDVGLIRPRGARIKTSGGTAPGPAPLVLALTQIAKRLNERHGAKITWEDAMLIDHYSAEAVVSGGKRRSARMSMKHWQDPDIFDFIQCKQVTGDHWTTNISVEIDEDFFRAIKRNDEHAIAVYQETIKGMLTNGEPGFYNSSLASVGELDDVRSTNPCITADTLVAVADGRGMVSIGELAKEGKDIPVYTVSDRNSIKVRMMRRPRKTGHQKEIYKVTLDDGMTIRATGNHKFILTNGDIVETTNLSSGDSLRSMTRFLASFPEIIGECSTAKRSQDYWFVNNGNTLNKSEHRLIAEFSYDTKITSDQTVHHIDFNAKNNDPSNLTIMLKADHDYYHSRKMLGDNNPMRRAATEWSKEKWMAYRQKQSANNSGENNSRFSGFSNEDLRNAALELTKILNRRASIKDWQVWALDRGYPSQFSKWRQDHLGGITGLLKWAAAECGYEYGDLDPRVLRRYQMYTSEGYDCEIINTKIIFNKNCEVCGCPFITEQREVGICSYACVNTKTWANEDIRAQRKETLRSFHEKRHDKIRIEQINIFNDLKFRLKRIPLKKEWQYECKKQDISMEVARESNPFTSWDALKEAAANFNHRVVSVEFDGYEDVYNGTVDEFHNLFIGGFESETPTGKTRLSFINTRQCGEQVLSAWDACCLGHVNLDHFYDDFEGASQAFRLMARFLLRATFSDYSDPKQLEVVKRNRRIGVGFFGFHGWLVKQGIRYSDSHRNPIVKKTLKDFYNVVRKEADRYAFQLRIPSPIKVTTVAPTGSIAKIPGATEGPQPIIFKYFIRRIRYSTISEDEVAIFDRLVAEGHEWEDDLWAANTKIIKYVMKDQLLEEVEKLGLDAEFLVESADEISLADMLAVQAMLQETYVDSAISFTINVEPDKVQTKNLQKQLDNNVLPADLTICEPAKDTQLEVGKTLLHYLPYVKGTTIMVNGSRPQSPYERINKEEYLNYIGAKLIGDGIDEECASGACPIK